MTKILYKSILASLALLSVAVGVYGQGYTRSLSTPNPSKEAAALYRYLLASEGKVILSGQQVATWGIDEMAYIQQNTGKQPAIRGMDYLRSGEVASETQEAINYWRRGGIPTIMWHFGAPGQGDGYEQSQMAVNFTRLFTPGTTEYVAFWNELKLKADALQKLRDANVPVLWRPYHECSGNWFWWGKGTAAQFKRVWTETYDYMVKTRGLNNLIWVLCYSGTPNAALFPGNNYVDIAGPDTYNTTTDAQFAMYNRAKAATGGFRMPIAFHECGVIPDPDQCFAQGANWSWWMEWHTGHLNGTAGNPAMSTAYLRRVYNHARIITLDEVPNIMQVYGGNPTAVEENFDSKSVNVYPNPVNEELNIDLPAGNAELGTQLSVYSMEGVEMLTEQVNVANVNLNTSSLNAGMYVLKIKNNGSEIFKKFSKVE